MPTNEEVQQLAAEKYVRAGRPRGEGQMAQFQLLARQELEMAEVRREQEAKAKAALDAKAAGLEQRKQDSMAQGVQSGKVEEPKEMKPKSAFDMLNQAAADAGLKVEKADDAKKSKKRGE